MMNEETLRKLTEMKMGAMAELYQQQSQNKEYKTWILMIDSTY